MKERTLNYINVMDKLNKKYVEEDAPIVWYPFSFEGNTNTKSILVFGTEPLWTDADGTFYKDEKGTIELEGEEFENALMAYCEEEYKQMIENLYAGYKKATKQNSKTCS